MYKVEIKSENKRLNELSNAQLFFSYIYLKRTFKYLYRKKLNTLSKKENRAIIYDLELFKKIKETKYKLRCCTPQKWLEDWEFYQGIKNELGKRNISKKLLEIE